MRKNTFVLYCLVPSIAVFLAFFLLPVSLLIPQSISGPEGVALYLQILTNSRYWTALLATVFLSILVTIVSLIIGGFAGIFLERNTFPFRNTIISMLTLPLSFPGVVVGFMIIMLAGRQGLIGELSKMLVGSKWVFAYSLAGLFAGYLYFSLPRVITTVMAAVSKMDISLEEAARTLGASPMQVLRHVTIPSMTPALISTGAICFATSIGAFGTAFTLATDIDVLPILIYTEFTLSANFATAAMLSVVLGIVTWAVLFLARIFGDNTEDLKAGA